MVVMEMDSGRVIHEESRVAYDDEVLNAGWAEVPRLERRLQEVPVSHRGPREGEVEGFLARLYAAQE